MSAAPDCDKVLLVQAELDGELDAAAAAALVAHRAQCPICQAAAVELARARGLIGGELHGGLYYAMPEDVRARVMTQISAARARTGAADSPAAVPFAVTLPSPAPTLPFPAPTLPFPAPTLPSPASGGGLGRGQSGEGLGGWAPGRWRRWPQRSWSRWWSSGASFGLGAACAAGLAFLVLVPRAPDLAEQIVSGHIRALQPGHLEDVASSDRHSVKPWFDGRVDFAPPVKDLAAERFPLRGARLDYVAGRPVAALVYQRDKHLIDLFVWPAAERAARPPEAASRQGYNVVHWAADGMALWAVSDLEAGQLREFAEDWRRSP